METLSNSLLTYNDYKYHYAANYTQYLYNFPICLNYGPKHKRVKYILGCGTRDSISLYKKDNLIYVLSYNTGLNYIALFVIDTETKSIIEDLFFNNLEECVFPDILDYSDERMLESMMLYMYL